MKMLRGEPCWILPSAGQPRCIQQGESVRALRPVLHPGIECREQRKLTGFSLLERMCILLSHAPTRAFLKLFTRHAHRWPRQGRARIWNTASAHAPSSHALPFPLIIEQVEHIYIQKSPQLYTGASAGTRRRKGGGWTRSSGCGPSIRIACFRSTFSPRSSRTSFGAVESTQERGSTHGPCGQDLSSQRHAPLQQLVPYREQPG